MSILEAVVTLATLVKQAADDANANSEHCIALSERINRIPRILSKFPNTSDLDEELLSKIFVLLKESHEAIREHNAQGRLRRMVNASATRQRFEQLATDLGVCLDDLNLCVGITSAAKLSQLQMGQITADISTPEATTPPLITDVEFTTPIDPLEHSRGYFLRGGFYRNQPVVCHEYLQLCVVDNNNSVREQFDAEIQRLMQLRHTNIAVLYNAYIDKSLLGNVYVIQEGFTSQNLSTFISSNPDLNTMLTIYHGIAAALFYLHSQSPPVIHGSLVPSRVEVTSYGVAKVVGCEQRYLQSLLPPTETNTWLAPEHIQGTTYSVAGDIYSLGLLMAYGVSKEVPVPVMRPHLQQVHYYTCSVLNTHKPLQDLINACVNIEPISRPGAVSVWRTLGSICAECGVTQKQDVAADDEEDDNDFCISDFGEMASQVESIHKNVKYFRHKDLSITCVGDKLLVQNIPKQVSVVDEESECSGTIVFHIDTTTSMSRENRMDITRNILQQVIPPFLLQKYHVIINAWASNATSKGCIQPREVHTTSEDIDELKSITLDAMSHLTPNGRTDLYGSVYQLLKQCASLPHRPVQAFIITDGNHNQLDYPQHKSRKGEKYFDTFIGAADGLWKKTNKKFDVPQAETFLGELYSSLFPNEELNISFIGIGEAHTKSLSDLSKALHKHSSFYGITETKEIDSVLQRISVAKTIEIAFSGTKLPLLYTYEDGDVTCGLATVSGVDALEKLYQQTALSIMCGDEKHEVELSPLSAQLCSDINDFAGQLRSIRDSTYEINEESLSLIFQKLMADKRCLLSLKSAYYSKDTKKLRYQDCFRALGIWLRYIEHLIDQQVLAYRMNVESELLTKFSEAKEYVAPSNVVLERLQNNVNIEIFYEYINNDM